jgi:hypothetical protein
MVLDLLGITNKVASLLRNDALSVMLQLEQVLGIACHVVVGQNPPTGVDRQHESWEARSLYPLALQLTRALRLKFVGRAT